MKKVLVLYLKLALNSQMAFTYSKSAIETLKQVAKYVQSLKHCSDLFVDFEQVNAIWVGWIVERNLFQSGTQVIFKIGS